MSEAVTLLLSWRVELPASKPKVAPRLLHDFTVSKVSQAMTISSETKPLSSICIDDTRASMSGV